MDSGEEKDDMKRSASTQLQKPTATITLTFGEVSENHVGMQKIGTLADKGFSIADLKTAQGKFEEIGCKCEYVDLNTFLPAGSEGTEAAVLIVRGGLEAILEKAGKSSSDMLKELTNLEWDSKAKMYGRVVSKTARHNLCFGNASQEPDYANGKGRIVAFDQIPIADVPRTSLLNYLPNADDLTIEGNLYYDVSKCGIGFHGDSERKKVVGVRLGASMPLHYQWFLRSEPVGTRCKLILNDADLYVMSEKATGNDWKKKTELTLRHAAGCDKFLTIKAKPKKDTKKKEKKKETKEKKDVKETKKVVKKTKKQVEVSESEEN